MRIGLCCSLRDARTIDLSPVDFVEGMAFDTLVPDKSDAEFRSNLARIGGLSRPVEALNCFIPGTIKTTDPETDSVAVDAYVRIVFDRARQCGVKIVVFGSGGSRTVPDGFPHEKAFAQLASHLKRWGDWAGEAGVTVVVEPLPKRSCNIILSIPEGLRLVETVAHPNVRLLADLHHMGCEAEPAANLGLAGGWLRHIHIAESPTGKFPGSAPQDFSPYLGELKAVGYAGAVSMECAFDNLAAELPIAAAYLRKQGRDAGL